MSLSLFRELEPLKRLSPSRYYQLKSCPLKEALQANRIPSMLPVAPAARLGSVAHRVLELAGQGCVATLEETWEEVLRQVENEMSEADEGMLLPLRESAQRYEVKKRLTFSAAQKIMDSFSHTEVSSATHLKTIGAEIWLESADGLIGGYVDRIVPIGQGVEIQDYKTGTVLEQETGDVKDAYESQLHLYAGLYYETTGDWPLKLTISSFGGRNYDIPVNTDRAFQLMNDARAELVELNGYIRSGYPLEGIARPSANACFFCGYRPACNPYWQARSSDRVWPADAKGPLVEVSRLGNGSLRAVIDDVAGMATVRGMPAERFSFLLEEPKAVMICDLRHDTVGGVYKPSKKTTGYVLEE